MKKEYSVCRLVAGVAITFLLSCSLAVAADRVVVIPLGGGSTPVDSVFGRTGPVTAQYGDYDATEITNFDTKVANNTEVVANTAKVSNVTHTGDVTGSSVLTITAGSVGSDELANTGVAPASYTNADITVDVDGRITAVSNGAAAAPVDSVAGKKGVVTLVAADITDFDTEVANNTTVAANTAKVSNVTHTGDVTGNTVLTIAADSVNSDELASTGVTEGSYTLASITVDDDGRITSASNGTGTGSITDQISILIDGGGADIMPGNVGFYVPVEWDATITQETLLCDKVGSISVDIWKDTYVNYPPTATDSITASAIPTINTDNRAKDAILTGWATSITAGDILGFNVVSAINVTSCTLTLRVTR